MELKQLQAELEEAGRAMQRRMQLDRWTIDFVASKSSDADDARHAACDLLLEYGTATITVFADRIQSRQRLLEVVRHELLHVTLADVDRMVQVAKAAIPESASEIFEVVRHHAEEGQLLQVERLLDYLGWTPSRLASDKEMQWVEAAGSLGAIQEAPRPSTAGEESRVLLREARNALERIMDSLRDHGFTLPGSPSLVTAIPSRVDDALQKLSELRASQEVKA